MPRYFDPDESPVINVKLTRQDWLVICRILNRTSEGLKNTELRDKVREMTLEIISQAKK